MNNKTSYLIIILSLVAAFLAGSTVAKIKYGEGEGIGSKKAEPTAAAVPTQTPFMPQKSEKPEIKFFVMSFCPYGNQTEAGLEPVYRLLGDKVVWSPRYIIGDQGDKIEACKSWCPNTVHSEEKCRQEFPTNMQTGEGPMITMTPEQCRQQYPYQSAAECIKESCDILKQGVFESLHGQQELNQDIREICVYNLGNLDKWWQFVSLVNEKCTSQNADTCWTAQAKTAGLDTGKISACEKGQKTALIRKEIAEIEKYQASGSPTVIINGTLYNGGRAPEDYKKAICSAFTVSPEECNTILGQESAGASGGCQ